MGKRIMVTGGAGYIGSHTTVELIQNGFDVLIVDNLVNARIEMLGGIEKITRVRPPFEQFDLCDMEALKTCCRKYGDIGAIIHFAALKAVGESVEKPLEYYGNNLISMINLLQVMRDYQIPDLVFSSSCTVYGQPDQLPVTELSPIREATSPYGNTKQISEEMITDFLVSAEGHRAISLRYFNPIGAHPSGWIGEYPIGPPLNLVPVITQALAGKRPALKVFGDDYDTADGTGVRDYIYVVDLAKAHVAAIRRLMNGQASGPFEVYNLGTGRGLSVMEIIQAFEKVLQREVPYQIYPRRPGDIACIYADTSKANEMLDWKADTPIEEVVRTAWAWEENIGKSNN